MYETTIVCQLNFSTVRHSVSLAIVREFTLIGFAVRVDFLRTTAPPPTAIVIVIGGWINIKTVHEAKLLGHAHKHIFSRFNMTATTSWVYNLLRHFVLLEYCVLPGMLDRPALQIAREDDGKVLVLWDDTIDTGSPLGMVRVTGANNLVHSPLLLVSSSSGAVQPPDQMSDFVLDMPAIGCPTEIEQMDRSILAGPALAELESA